MHSCTWNGARTQTHHMYLKSAEAAGQVGARPQSIAQLVPRNHVCGHDWYDDDVALWGQRHDGAIRRTLVRRHHKAATWAR